MAPVDHCAAGRSSRLVPCDQSVLGNVVLVMSTEVRTSATEMVLTSADEMVQTVETEMIRTAATEESGNAGTKMVQIVGG